MDKSNEVVLENKGFNWFKGLVFIILPLIILVSALFSSGIFNTEAKDNDSLNQSIMIKGFKLGMSKQEFEEIIHQTVVNSKYSNPPKRFNSCSEEVRPFNEGFSEIPKHLFDLACSVWNFDLASTVVEVIGLLHNDKLVWLQFKSNGVGPSLGSNDILIGVLSERYGKPKMKKYNDLFGASEGLFWETKGSKMILKSSILTLSSKSGREEMDRREALRKQKIKNTL